MESFSGLEPVCCSTSSSNCCFLTCIQFSHEAIKMVACSHLFKNFPQFVVIHTVKGFSIINGTEVDVFLEFSCFFYDPTDVGNLISGSSAFSKSSLNFWKFSIQVLLKPSWEDFEHWVLHYSWGAMFIMTTQGRCCSWKRQCFSRLGSPVMEKMLESGIVKLIFFLLN